MSMTKQETETTAQPRHRAGWKLRCGRNGCWRPWKTGSQEANGIGPMPSSLDWGYSPYMKPMHWHANPAEETTDWRAVCGRTTRTVRRAGRTSIFPDPVRCFKGTLSALDGL